MKAVAQLAAMSNLTVSMPCWGSAIALNAALHFAASLPAWPHTDNPPYPMLVEYDVGDNPLRDLLGAQCHHTLQWNAAIAGWTGPRTGPGPRDRVEIHGNAVKYAKRPAQRRNRICLDGRKR